MIPVFVFATLKKKKIQEQALGHTVRTWLSAILPDYEEVYIGQWPTIVPRKGSQVPGEIFSVNNEEFQKLKNWEDRYWHVKVETDRGPAFAFVLKNTDNVRL